VISFFHKQVSENKKPSLQRIHPSAARPSSLRPAAFPAFTISGVAGFPPVSAGKRPTITRGLALSGLSFF